MNKFITKNGDKCTHLLLNGGKLFVENNTEFLDVYTQELEKGSKLYVVEKRPDVFKYMIDLDILDNGFWDFDRILPFCKYIQKIVYDFFLTDLNMLILNANPKQKNENTKSGYHLIWPRLFLKAEQALTLREAILQNIPTHITPPLNKWEDAIDSLVYLRNGYRMVGSDKMINGKPENRVYNIVGVIDSQGNTRDQYLSRLKNNLGVLVKETSIREVISNVQEFEQIPKWFKGGSVLTQKNKKRFKATNVNSNILVKFIREKLPSCYKHQNIKDIRKYEDGNLLVITDSRWCLNINRDHNSCGIYFLVTPRGVYQKCLCPCENLNGRIYGYCRDFTSLCFEFDDKTSAKIFGTKGGDKIKSTSVPPVVSIKSLDKDNYIKNVEVFCQNYLKF